MHIEELLEMEIRQAPKIKISREGRLIRGHVLDVSRAPLLAALRRYDHLLYLQWNPHKRAGQGVWEIRRQPEEKTALYAGKFQGMNLYALEYKELNLVNHVLDVPYLNYSVLTRLKEMDMWQYGYKGSKMVQEADYREAKFLNKVDEEADAQKQYMIKQHKTLINDFKEYVLSGHNPYRLADVWGKEK